MKINKIMLLLLLLIPFLTGCNVNVELDVSYSGIKENIQFIDFIDEEHSEESIISAYKKYETNNINDLSEANKSDEKISGVSYYDMEQETYNTFVKNTYSTSYTFSSFKNSRTLNAIKGAYITDGTDYIELSTDKNGLLLYNTYSDLGDLKITIKSDLEVIDNNADSYSDGKYVWLFSRNDVDKDIYIKFKKNGSYTDNGGIALNNNSREIMDGNLQTLYLTLLLLAIGLVVALFSSVLIKLAIS